MTPGFSAALCQWFEKHGRDMPWRDTRDPYAIWISEIMLQQTQVDTVRPYYARFMTRWPTIESLANAEDADVLKMWEGLGYYARCRNLHRAARLIVSEHNGRFPDTIEDVVALPGIGRSTAGAILTFAYDQRHPLLDGNVKRVLSRITDEPNEISRSQVEKKMWALSEQLLMEATDPWTHNQASMELGAQICTRRAPQCDACPVHGWCKSAANGTQLERPVKKKKKPTPHFNIGIGVISDDSSRVLIQLRPPTGLLGGLWEFPGGKQEPKEDICDTVSREIQEELGIAVAVTNPITTVKHAYSHFRITLHAYNCRLISGKPKPRAAVECKWVPISELDKYAFPKANKTVLEALLSQHNTA